MDPEASAPAAALPPTSPSVPLLPGMLASSNFFSGCNPRAIHTKLASHFQADLRPGSLRALAPWKWRIGGHSDKHFLVHAVVFQKAG